MQYSITYDEVKEKQKVSGVCEKCGKKRIRTVSDSQTLNPFNRNKAGFSKTLWEIKAELRISIQEQVKKLKAHFICATCWDELPYPKQWPEKHNEPK